MGAVVKGWFPAAGLWLKRLLACILAWRWCILARELWKLARVERALHATNRWW